MTLGEIQMAVERGAVRRFARALHDPSPIYVDEAAARRAGFDGIPAPLTFLATLVEWTEGGQAELIDRLGLDLARVLHGEVSWRYHRPVLVGDELTATRSLLDTTTRAGKRGGEMTLVSVETEFRDTSVQLVAVQRDVLIEVGR